MLYAFGGIVVVLLIVLIYLAASGDKSLIDRYGAGIFVPGLLFTIITLVIVSLVFYSASSMKQRKRYNFSFFFGYVLFIFFFPLGMIMGVLVISRLGNKSIKALYKEADG